MFSEMDESMFSRFRINHVPFYIHFLFDIFVLLSHGRRVVAQWLSA